MMYQQLIQFQRWLAARSVATRPLLAAVCCCSPGRRAHLLCCACLLLARPPPPTIIPRHQPPPHHCGSIKQKLHCMLTHHHSASVPAFLQTGQSSCRPQDFPPGVKVFSSAWTPEIDHVCGAFIAHAQRRYRRGFGDGALESSWAAAGGERRTSTCFCTRRSSLM